MLRRRRDARGGNQESRADRNHRPAPRRQRRPILDGLEHRQVLSAAAPVAPAAVAPAAVDTGSVIFQPVQLPILRAEAGRPFEGVVATFISNSRVPSGQLSATIDWGDGTVSTGIVQPNPWSGFNVQGDHVYDLGVNGATFVRTDIYNNQTGEWVYGVEQKAWISRPKFVRAALEDVGLFQAPDQPEPAERPAPMRLRLVGRRQHFQDARDRFAQGTASADDLRFLRKVQYVQEQQNRGFWEELGDEFSSGFFFD